jgi:hypothetical protein
MTVRRARRIPAASKMGGFPDGAEIPGTAENIQAVVGEPTP